MARARAGVTVRVLYDWFGALRPSSFRFWAPLVAAGGQVRVSNQPRFHTLFNVGSRDHRKLLTVDGRSPSSAASASATTGSGIRRTRFRRGAIRASSCAGRQWLRRSSPLRAPGPRWGEGLPAGTVPASDSMRAEGHVNVRVVATSPDRTTLYRLELAALAAATDRIWLTDAYFMGTAVYIESLSAASRHGVDVRLLVPNNSDVPWLGNLSRTLYRRLLDDGVRIFEWNGPMVHAKTAVADRRFVRVGSTNLNLSSWVGNWELDVVIEDAGLAAQMEEIYDRDLRNATEIVITERNTVRLRADAAPSAHRRATDCRAGGWPAPPAAAPIA